MKKMLKMTLCALTASVLAASWTAAEEVSFTIALDSDIVALDPIFAYDFTTNPVTNQITEPLLAFDYDNQLQPMLASGWEMTDETTFVYQIRNDVCFSDGTPMTMDDVLFSIGRSLDPDYGSYLNWMFSGVESIEQTGDWEMTVKLTEPSATWQYVMATSAGHVISKAYYEEHEADFGTASGGILGTGPYVYESWTDGQEVVLKKNENYWDKEQDLAIDTLVYKIIPDDSTRVTAALNDEIDCMVSTPPDLLEKLEEDEDLEIQDIATAGITFLAMNTRRAPFDDVNVRKAVTAAINRADIQEYIVKDAGLEGGCLPGSQVLFTFEPDAWNDFAENNNAVTYDPEKAAEYLAASEYPDGFDCNMIISENSLRYAIALYIQDALSQIGINVELVKVSGDEHTNYQFGGVWDEEGFRDYDMIMAGWESDYPDISGNIEPLLDSSGTGEGGTNSAEYVNDEVDEKVRAAAGTTDAAIRTKNLLGAMEIANEECPYIYLSYPNRQVTIRRTFTGFKMNSSWLWNLTFKDLKKAE